MKNAHWIHLNPRGSECTVEQCFTGAIKSVTVSTLEPPLCNIMHIAQEILPKIWRALQSPHK